MYLLLVSSTIVVCLKNPLVLDNGRLQGRHLHFLFEIYRSKVHNWWMQFLAYSYFPFGGFCSAYWMNQRESLRVFKSKFQNIFLVSWVKDICFMPNSPARPHRFLMCSFFFLCQKENTQPFMSGQKGNATTIRWSKSLLSLLVSGEVCLLIIHDMISSTDNGTLMIW